MQIDFESNENLALFYFNSEGNAKNIFYFYFVFTNKWFFFQGKTSALIDSLHARAQNFKSIDFNRHKLFLAHLPVVPYIDEAAIREKNEMKRKNMRKKLN